MKLKDWPEYWHRRCVKAEEMLISLAAALEKDRPDLQKKITAHFEQIAEGDKANYVSPFAAPDTSKEN